MSEQLKPCPFCGNATQLVEDGDHHGEFFSLGCSSRDCAGYHAYYTESASHKAECVAAWNRRADDAALSRLRDTQRVLVEALRLLVDKDLTFASGDVIDGITMEDVSRARAALASVEEQPDSDHLTPAGDEEVTARDAASRVLSDDDVEWVVNDNAELGVKIGGQFFWLYKGGSLVYGTTADSVKDGFAMHDDGERQLKWRPVFKREFGECCHPVNYADLRKCGYPHQIGTVSPDDSDEWRPLPAAMQEPKP